MKIVLKVLAGLIVFVIVAVVAVSLLFDPNDYKPQIEELAKENADINLEINGDIGWSMFPTLGLELPQVNAQSLQGEPIASLKSAQIAVNIPALFGGEVKMNGITIDGLELAIKPETDSKEKSDDEAVDGHTNQADGGFALDIGDVVLKDANIRYEDANGQVITISNFNFNGENVSSSKSFPASMSFALNVAQDQQQVVDLNTELSTQILLNTVAQVYELIDLDMTVTVTHEALGSKPQDIKLSGNLVADLTADKAALSNFVVGLANLSLNANMDVLNMSSAPQLKGDISIPAFDAKALMATLEMPAVATQNEKALTAVGLSAKLAGPANVIALESLNIQLDSTTFKGQLSHNLKSNAQRITLAGDSINVDDYLPPTSEQKEPSQKSTSGERYPKTPLLPIEVLQGINLNADLALTKLTASGLKVENLKLLADAKNGLINLSQVSGDLYNGNFNNSIVIDARKTPLKMTSKKNVSNVQIGGLLKDLTQQDMLSGVFNLKGNYQMEGNSVYDIVNTIDGKVNMSLKDGRIQGVNLIDKLCSGIMSLKGQKPDPAAAVDYTEFSNLSTSANITNGLVSNKDLKAALVGVNLTGAGTVNLPKESLDYGLSLTILQELKGPNCQLDNKLHNLSLPLRCKGHFDDDPASMCGIDKNGMSKVLADLGAAEIKAKAEAQVEKAKEDVKEKVEDKVKNKLKGLFGG